MFFAGLWLLLRDGKGYGQYIRFLLLGYLIAMAIYLIWPGGQDLWQAVASVSTVFVKQHGVLDVAAGALLSAALYPLAYAIPKRKN